MEIGIIETCDILYGAGYIGGHHGDRIYWDTWHWSIQSVTTFSAVTLVILQILPVAVPQAVSAHLGVPPVNRERPQVARSPGERSCSLLQQLWSKDTPWLTLKYDLWIPVWLIIFIVTILMSFHEKFSYNSNIDKQRFIRAFYEKKEVQKQLGVVSRTENQIQIIVFSLNSYSSKFKVSKRFKCMHKLCTSGAMKVQVPPYLITPVMLLFTKYPCYRDEWWTIVSYKNLPWQNDINSFLAHQVEVFNLLFVAEVEKKHVVHCLDCGRKMSLKFANFTILNQYKMEELMLLYDNFQLGTIVSLKFYQ